MCVHPYAYACLYILLALLEVDTHLNACAHALPRGSYTLFLWPCTTLRILRPLRAIFARHIEPCQLATLPDSLR